MGPITVANAALPIGAGSRVRMVCTNHHWANLPEASKCYEFILQVHLMRDCKCKRDVLKCLLPCKGECLLSQSLYYFIVINNGTYKSR